MKEHLMKTLSILRNRYQFTVKAAMRSILTISILIIGHHTWAQQGGRGDRDPDKIPSFKVSGLVFDEETNSPVEYSTVSLFLPYYGIVPTIRTRQERAPRGFILSFLPLASLALRRYTRRGWRHLCYHNISHVHIHQHQQKVRSLYPLSALACSYLQQIAYFITPTLSIISVGPMPTSITWLLATTDAYH